MDNLATIVARHRPIEPPQPEIGTLPTEEWGNVAVAISALLAKLEGLGDANKT
jgi:hypothetical protein